MSMIFRFKRIFNKFGNEYPNFFQPLQIANQHRTKKAL